MPRFLVFLVTLLVHAIRAACRSRAELVLENLALRQQVCGAACQLGSWSDTRGSNAVVDDACRR
ncbi:MAG: hypothetical protein JRI68_35225 [Deltaproteobacteria bacterium]|nr:hypothetical protein [Deltaproteobacteria bacterium]